MSMEASLTQISSGLRHEFHYHFWLWCRMLKETGKTDSRWTLDPHRNNSNLIFMCYLLPSASFHPLSPLSPCELSKHFYVPLLGIHDFDLASWLFLWIPLPPVDCGHLEDRVTYETSVASGCLAHSRSLPTGFIEEGLPHTWHRQASPAGKCSPYL